MPRSRSQPKESLNEITDFLSESYVIDEEVDSGGSGIVYKGHKAHDPDLVVAIKFYVIPAQASFLQQTTFKALILPEDEEAFKAEFQFLKRTRHPGIQEVVSYGVLADPRRYFADREDILIPKSGPVRFLISRYIEGARLRDWVINLIRQVGTQNVAEMIPAREARHDLCRALFEIADTLAYVHDTRQYQHSDLRADNILIHNASRRPIIIDFGYAHCFDPALTKSYTHVRYVPENLPPTLRSDLGKLLKGGDNARVPRRELRDLVFPGLDLYNLGSLITEVLDIPGIDTVLTNFDRDFLRLIARRLANWRTAKESRAAEIADQMKKLEIGLHVPGRSTSPEIEKHVALPTGALNLTSTMEALLSTRAMRRLQLLNQLSFVNQIYPGASQSRFEHSLAAYETTTQLVQALSRSPRFRILFDESGITKLLLVALLHDVNHFPFLHYFQEHPDQTLKRTDVLDLFCEGKATGDSPSVYELLSREGIPREEFRGLLLESYDTLADPQSQVIRSIIDSGVDVDKLTYVRDDARFTGVPFGLGVDREALFEHADIVQLRVGTSSPPKFLYHLCFKPEALSAVESLMMARFWNFRQIYWHHTNRAIGAMISHVISRIFSGGAADFSAFLTRTIGKTDSGALEVLDEMHRQQYKRPSIIAGLGSRRQQIFKRLISIRGYWEEQEQDKATANARLFSDLSKLSPSARVDFLSALRGELARIFKSDLGARSLTDDDVLLDVPGRTLDEQVGVVHVCDLTPEGRPTSTLRSPFIEQLLQQFAALSRTVRIFIAPDVRERIGAERIDDRRADIQAAITLAIKSARGAPDTYK